MPLPLLPVLGAAAATGARVALTAGARLGMGALRVGGSIAGRLATSFGGALVAGGTALTRAVTPQQTQGGPEESNTEAEATQGAAGVQAEEIQTTPTAVAATGPSTGGDIAGSLRDTPLTVLRQIEDNTKQTAQAIGSLSRAERYRREPMFYGRQDPRDISGAQGSLLLALVPLLASAFQSATEPLRNAIESTRQFVEGVANTVSGALNSIGEAFSRVASLFPSAAGPEAQPGGPEAETRRQALQQAQVRATNEFSRIMRGSEIPANVRDELQEQLLSGRATTTREAERIVAGYIPDRRSPAFQQAMQAFESINAQRQRDAAYGAGEAGTLDFPEAPPPPPANRTVDSRTASISREDRAQLDEVARSMGTSPMAVIGGVFTPNGEVEALILPGGTRREVPAEVRTRNRTERFAVEAQRANSTAAADEYSSPDVINQINRGIEPDEDAALRVADRLRTQMQQQNQTPVVVPVQVPAAPAAATPPATRATPSSAAPPPGAGSPASPPPVYPRMINEGSPAGTRS